MPAHRKVTRKLRLSKATRSSHKDILNSNHKGILSKVIHSNNIHNRVTLSSKVIPKRRLTHNKAIHSPFIRAKTMI
jgi:hypothetical protein